MGDNIVNLIKENDYEEFINKTRSIENISLATYSIEIYDKYSRNNVDDPGKTLPSDQLTLLHVAAYYDAIDIFCYLIQTKGIPINILSGHSFWPLHYACWNGSEEVALYILSQESSIEILTSPSPAYIHILYCATRGRDIEILNNLFNRGANLNCNQANDILNLAIRLGQKDIIKCLYDHYTFSNTNENQDLWNLPMRAVHTQNLEAFQILYKGPTDLFVQTAGIYISLIGMICKHDSINKKFKSELIKILNDNCNMKLEPPIPGPGLCHWACEYGDLDVLKAMMKIDDFRINRLDKQGKAGPSYFAGTKRKVDYDILNLLIDNGFDITIQKSPSLLEDFVCGYNKRCDIINLLIQKGADIFAILSKTEKDENPMTLYDYVMSIKRPNREMKKVIDIFKYTKKAIDEKKNNLEQNNENQ